MAINMSLAADLLTSSARQRKREGDGRGTEREREESATVSDQSAELPSGRTLPQRHNSTHAAGQAASGEGRGVGVVGGAY